MGAVPQPVRVVISQRLNLSQDSQLALSARDVPLWLVHGPEAEAETIAAWETLGARLIASASDPHGLDMGAAMRALGAAGLTRVFCEGGGGLAAALLRAGVVNRLAGFTAGLALGADAHPAIAALALDRLGAAPRFRLEEVRAVGADTLTLWHRA